jgi:hypothetical protein
MSTEAKTYAAGAEVIFRIDSALGIDHTLFAGTATGQRWNGWDEVAVGPVVMDAIAEMMTPLLDGDGASALPIARGVDRASRTGAAILTGWTTRITALGGNLEVAAPSLRDVLTAEYDAWLAENAQLKVPPGWDMSADELVLHAEWFTREQRQWLTSFIIRWEDMENADRA